MSRCAPLLGAAVLAAPTAMLGQTPAQAPSRVTPREVRPPAQAPAAPPPVAAAPAAVPPGAESLRVTVGEVVVEGGFPELAAQTQGLTAPFRNRRATVAEIYALAAAIEQAYARAGFVLVRVNPPPQDLNDGGVVRLVVVDGFIESVDLAGVDPHVRRPVAMYVHPLIGRRHLTEGELERQVLLAGQVAGAALTTALGKGQAPGGVKLVVNAAWSPLSGQLSLDNHQGEAFGKRAANAQFAVGSAFGLGEQLYGFLSFDPDLSKTFGSHAPRRVASLGLNLPVGAGGLVLNPEATVSRTYPRPLAGAPPSYGIFDRYVARATWPVILRRGYGLDAALAVEAVNERQDAYQFGFTLSHDELRIARLTLDDHDGAFGPFSLRGRLEASRGFHGLGARTPEDAAGSGTPLSRPGVTGEFTKLAFDGQAAAPAPFGATLQAFLRAQAAADGVMPSSELFALDGPTALSSYDAGATGADAGWTLRLQVGRTFTPKAWGGQAALTPYAYAAAGQASYKVPNLGQITGATDFGLGLDARFARPKSRFRPFVTLEVGHHNQDGLTPADSRISIAAGVAL